MKKTLSILLVLMMVATTAFAATDNVVEGMGQKAVRGAVNMVTAVVEIPMQIVKGFDKGVEPIENEALSKTVGTVLGLFRGFSHAGGRFGWGALELTGFWSANPEDNMGVGIPFDAEYAWEEGVQYSIFEPSFEEGIKPIGHKLTRGLGNGFFGILEVPGQTLRGASEGNVVKGLVKGFWFWGSRTVYGLGDVMTVIVPNPVENPGYAFNGKWPWTVLNEEMEGEM